MTVPPFISLCLCASTGPSLFLSLEFCIFPFLALLLSFHSLLLSFISTVRLAPFLPLCFIPAALINLKYSSYRFSYFDCCPSQLPILNSYDFSDFFYSSFNHLHLFVFLWCPALRQMQLTLRAAGITIAIKGGIAGKDPS